MFRTVLLALVCLVLFGCGDKSDSKSAAAVVKWNAPDAGRTRWRPTAHFGSTKILSSEEMYFASDVGIYNRFATEGDTFYLDAYGKAVVGKILFSGRKVTLNPETIDGVAIGKLRKVDAAKEPGEARHLKLLSNPIVGICLEDKSSFMVVLDLEEEVRFTSEASMKPAISGEGEWLIGDWEGTTAGNPHPNVTFSFWRDGTFLSDHPAVFGGTWDVKEGKLVFTSINTGGAVKEGAKGPNVQLFGDQTFSAEYVTPQLHTVNLSRKKPIGTARESG